MKLISVGLSIHRPEALDITVRLMAQHQAIYLEEPPTPGFYPMLEGRKSIASYLLETDTEYPEFTRLFCQRLRNLHKAGISIYQVEPYLEELIGIHDCFASGGSPKDISPGSSQFAVYQGEKSATGLLINYYRTTMNGSFEEIVASVKQFAKADAQRFILRDTMRADALISLIPPSTQAYIEAGDIHQYLVTRLRMLKDEGTQVKRRYPLSPVIQSLVGKPYIYAPGDILTLGYIYKYAYDENMQSLLAARSLIYNKLTVKTEISNGLNLYPHVKNQIDAIDKTRRLTWEDSRDVFERIRLENFETAHKVVDDRLDSMSR